MASASANVKNLEQIQETEPVRSSSRLTALLLASLAGTALVLVGVMMSSSHRPAEEAAKDPLAELVLKAKNEGTPSQQLDASDVTFPKLLSDENKPTTALAAVRDERGNLVKAPPEAGLSNLAPAPGDRLPVVPLPAGTLLNASPVTTEPKDQLSALAVSAAETHANAAEPAAPGSDAGFQIQVASFKEQADADAFVTELRKRGHEAFRVAALIPGRGLWHRVRVGPFKTKFQAVQYKNKFENSERMAPFVVDPERVKQAEEMRQKKLEARVEKYGEP
jgi:cell division septation protein DedD